MYAYIVDNTWKNVNLAINHVVHIHTFTVASTGGEVTRCNPDNICDYSLITQHTYTETNPR